MRKKLLTIVALLLFVATDAWAQEPTKYTVKMAEGTEDASKWTISPTEATEGTKITATYSGTKRVKSVTAVVKAAAKPTELEGLLKGQFSVSAEKKVQFSKGNLRYDSSSGSWSFFDYQYQFYIGYTATYWDKFGWSTSTTTFGMSTSIDYDDYSGDFVDWGTNAISNGGNTANLGWRTLTSDEWDYLFNTRSATTVNGEDNARYAKAKLFNNTYGVILFPDSYTHPDGVALPTGINNSGDTSWDGNKYTDADWAKMEAAGCVFLPAAGYRYGETVYKTNEAGYYWSSSPDDATNAYSVNFNNYALLPSDSSYGSSYRSFDCSVRLVYDVK